MANVKIENIIDKFSDYTHKPAKFLVVQEELKDDIKNFVKSLYDYTKSEERISKNQSKSALPELIVQDFDEEQIWQEIELQNAECWDKLVWEVANCMSGKNDLIFPVDIVEESKEQSITEDDDDEVDNDLSDSEKLLSDQDNEPSKINNKKPKKSKKDSTKKKEKGSIVDDKFFKLKDMEKFLINEEKKDGNKKNPDGDSDEESIDMFEDVDDDESEREEGNDMMYSDFFDAQEEEEEEGSIQTGDDNNGDGAENNDSGAENDDEEIDDERQVESNKKMDKKVKFAGLSSDDDDHSSEEEMNLQNGKVDKNEKKSDFEQRQERLQQTITRLEEKSMKEAPWQLKGEVNALKRPQNSLLEEVVDFDLTSRPPPLITEQTTVTLEDIIKRRIKDKAWDDVEKKEKPVDDQLSFRKTEIIDQSKSKLSLAQVYEAEYLKQKQALSGEVDEEKEPEAHTEIRDTMNKLFAKLDALCHYHYTPKAPQAEVKIVSNTPAISMEEVAPVATSDAALLAPEEVKKKNRGELMSKDERSQTDKNRERRKKKKLQRLKGPVSKVTDHRNTKKGVEANDKSLKTSKAFFQQLNDDATSIIKSKKKAVKNKGQ